MTTTRVIVQKESSERVGVFIVSGGSSVPPAQYSPRIGESFLHEGMCTAWKACLPLIYVFRNFLGILGINLSCLLYFVLVAH